jgi:hypothetical protein
VATSERSCPVKACKRCGTVKSHSEFYSCKQRADGVRADCKACTKEMSAAAYVSNKQRRYVQTKNWQGANKERVRANRLRAYQQDPRPSKEATMRWRRANLVRHREYRREYRQINPASVVASELRRKRALEQACVKWASSKAMSAIYRRARSLSKSGAGVFEVDHVVPLRHPLVCGLHVEFNLKILPRTENRQKSNRFWPDMPN